MADEVAGMVVKLAMEDGSFQEGIANLNRQMKVVDSEFKGAVGNSKDFGNSVDGLKSNLDRLNKATEIQTQLIGMYQERLGKSKSALDQNVQSQEKLKIEIDTTRKAYEDAVSSIGKNSKEALELKESLEKLEKKYDDNNQKIRNNVKTIDNHTVALNGAKAKLKDFENQMDTTSKAVNDFGQDMDNVNNGSGMSLDVLNVAMGNLVADGVQMLISGIQELAKEAVQYAADMEKLSLQTGMTKTELQQWDAVLMQTGSSIREADGDLAMLAERINEASMGTGEGLEVWNQLGLSVVDSTGKLKSQGDVLNETVIALQNMEDVTRRNALASQLLGSTGENLMPILNATNEQLAAIKGNATIISDEDLNAINSFRSSLVEFCDGAGKQIIGILADVATLLTPIVKLLDMILTPLLSVAGAITDAIAEPFRILNGEVDTAGKAIENGAKQATGSIKETYSKTEESCKTSMQGVTDATNSAFDSLNKAYDGFKGKEMSKYEEQLRKQYGSDSLANEKAIQKKLKQHEDYLNSKLEKDQAYEENKAQMESKYRKVYSKQDGVNTISYERIPSYASGTKYHPGGLAMVHKDELLNLPKGTEVSTKADTQQIMSKSSGKTNINLYGPITIVANEPKEFGQKLQLQVRAGVS